MADGEKLGKLRKKLQEVTELIENADQKKTDCKHANVEANAGLEKLETELQSSQRRTVLIKKDLAHTLERLKINEEKLGKSNATSEDVETERDALETKESEDDEKIQGLEEQIKEMKRTVEINELKVVEGERKVKVLEGDIAGIRKQAEGHEARVAALEETIENHGKKVEELEEREGEMGDREQLNEEKVDFLERELKETTVRAEAAERNCAVLRNTMMETETEISKWDQKIKDMEDQMILMDDVADDPAYAFDMSLLDGDVGRQTPTSFNDRAELFNKKAAEEPRSRSESRASDGRGSAQPPTPQPEAAPEPEPEPEPESEPEPEPESEAEPEAEPEAVAEAEVEADAVAEVESAPPAEAPQEAEEEEEEEESEEDDW